MGEEGEKERQYAIRQMAEFVCADGLKRLRERNCDNIILERYAAEEAAFALQVSRIFYEAADKFFKEKTP